MGDDPIRIFCLRNTFLDVEISCSNDECDRLFHLPDVLRRVHSWSHMPGLKEVCQECHGCGRIGRNGNRLCHHIKTSTEYEGRLRDVAKHTRDDKERWRDEKRLRDVKRCPGNECEWCHNWLQHDRLTEKPRSAKARKRGRSNAQQQQPTAVAAAAPTSQQHPSNPSLYMVPDRSNDREGKRRSNGKGQGKNKGKTIMRPGGQGIIALGTRRLHGSRDAPPNSLVRSQSAPPCQREGAMKRMNIQALALEPIRTSHTQTRESSPASVAGCHCNIL